jgi:hypothetical protein
MAISAGFFGRGFHRKQSLARPLADLLPPMGWQLRTRVEPHVAELVGATVASLRVAGLSPVPVTDPHGRHWAPAYVLGGLEDGSPLLKGGSRMAIAEVVLDSSGRLVRNHPVQVVGNAHKLTAVSCPSLAEGYEQFIRAVRMAEEPRGDAMVLTRHGELMLGGPGGEPVALADYLDRLSSAVTRSSGWPSRR